MTVSQEPREFLSGKLAQVDVGRIEKELRALWQQAKNREEGIAGDIVRAASFTLVLFSTDEGSEDKLAVTLDELMAVHPCRAILTFFRQDKPHALDAWVTARCHLMGGKKHVCSEQITIYADGALPGELASVVSPLVLSDLPVVLWWRSRNLDHPVMQALTRCTRKIIFDSSYEPFSLTVLTQAADRVIQEADCIWLADLNWRRLDGWRRSLAEAFDGFPMDTGYLTRIRGVKVMVAAGADSTAMSTQGLLLTGWMASRLEWHHERDKTKRDAIGFRSGKTSFEVEYLADVASPASSGTVESVEIMFDDGRELKVVLERHGESFLITAHEANTESKESTRVDQHFSESILVGQELELMSRDRIFEQSLLVAGEFTRLVK